LSWGLLVMAPARFLQDGWGWGVQGGLEGGRVAGRRALMVQRRRFQERSSTGSTIRSAHPPARPASRPAHPSPPVVWCVSDMNERSPVRMVLTLHTAAQFKTQGIRKGWLGGPGRLVGRGLGKVRRREWESEQRPAGPKPCSKMLQCHKKGGLV
jgi:hypothetical protein